MRSTLKLLLALTLFETSALAASVPNGPVILQGTVSTGGGANTVAIAGADVTLRRWRPGPPTATGNSVSR